MYYDKATWAETKNEIASTLKETYDKLLLQLRDCEGRTKDLLQFLLAAYKSFTVLELNMLLALESRPQTLAFVLEKAREIGHAIDRDVYGSFLRPVKDAKRCEQVRLVHETAREYLLRPDRKISKYPVEMRDCHLILAER